MAVLELKDAKVAVVDDDLATRDWVVEGLTPHCAEVVAISPDKALDELGQNHHFDIVTLDLRYLSSNMEGSIAPADGIALLKELKSIISAVAFTASINNLYATRLSSAAVDSKGNQVVRVASKRDGLDVLRKHLTGALTDLPKIDPEERSRVIANLPLPDFANNLSYKQRQEIVAAAVENLGGLLRSTKGAIAELKAECSLEDWPSWGMAKNRIQKQVGQLEKMTAEKMMGNSSQHTGDALHEIMGRIPICDLSDLRVPESLTEAQAAQVSTVLGGFKIQHQAVSQVLNDLFEKQKEQAKAEIDLNPLLEEAFIEFTHGDRKAVYAYGPKEEAVTTICDPDGYVQSLLDALQEICTKHKGHSDIRHHNDNCTDSFGYNSHLREKINWGQGYSFSLRLGDPDLKDSTWEEAVEALKTPLLELQKLGVLHCSPRQFSETTGPWGESFEFYLKTAEYDDTAFKAKAKKDAEREAKFILADQGTFLNGDEEVKFYKFKLEAGEVTCIGFDPRSNFIGDYSLMVKESQLCIASHKTSHVLADGVMFEYLRKINGLEIREAFVTARNTIRLKVSESEMIVNSQDDDVINELSEYVEALGVTVVKSEARDFNRRERLDTDYLWLSKEDYTFMSKFE